MPSQSGSADKMIGLIQAGMHPIIEVKLFVVRWQA